MTTGDVIALLAALGAGGILSQLIKNVSEWLKGRKRIEREAWNERDREAAKRRRLEEALHATRRVAMEHGLTLDQLPDWPTY
jgi:hypothetical protein